jgi:hypothetical protein
MPQLSSTYGLIMAANNMYNALKHPHPEVPFLHIGDDTIEALTKLAKIFKNKFQKVQIPGHSNAPAKAAENKIPANLSHPSAITSKGGHTNDGSAYTSEGANALTKSFTPEFVPRRLFQHGNCQQGHCLGESPLVSATFRKCRRSPSH